MSKQCYISCSDTLMNKLNGFIDDNEKIETPSVWSSIMTRAMAINMHNIVDENDKQNLSAEIMKEILENCIFYVLKITRFPSQDYNIYKDLPEKEKKVYVWTQQDLDNQHWQWSLQTTAEAIKANIRNNLRFKYRKINESEKSGIHMMVL